MYSPGGGTFSFLGVFQSRVAISLCFLLLINPLVNVDEVSGASKKDDGKIDDLKDGKELQKLIEDNDYVAVLWCKGYFFISKKFLFTKIRVVT